jgi:hypothetical protein
MARYRGLAGIYRVRYRGSVVGKNSTGYRGHARV